MESLYFNMFTINQEHMTNLSSCLLVQLVLWTNSADLWWQSFHLHLLGFYQSFKSHVVLKKGMSLHMWQPALLHLHGSPSNTLHWLYVLQSVAHIGVISQYSVEQQPITMAACCIATQVVLHRDNLQDTRNSSTQDGGGGVSLL